MLLSIWLFSFMPLLLFLIFCRDLHTTATSYGVGRGFLRRFAPPFLGRFVRSGDIALGNKHQILVCAAVREWCDLRNLAFWLACVYFWAPTRTHLPGTFRLQYGKVLFLWCLIWFNTIGDCNSAFKARSSSETLPKASIQCILSRFPPSIIYMNWSVKLWWNKETWLRKLSAGGESNVALLPRQERRVQKEQAPKSGEWGMVNCWPEQMKNVEKSQWDSVCSLSPTW